LEVTDKNKELFKRILRTSLRDLRHAINRFSRACTEIKDESILDFVIALEATLGYKLNSEIAHRLSSRGAFLLAADPSNRERYYSIFKALYRILPRQKFQNHSLRELPRLATGQGIGLRESIYSRSGILQMSHDR
jgi:hypothetical protein